MNEIKNAIIKDVTLGFKDNGILDMWLHLDYGGSCQGFGGYALYLPKSFKNHNIQSVAGHFIFRCLEVAGVESYSDLKGKCIRVKIENGLIKKIGHIVKNDWFCPKEEFKNI